MKAGRQDEEMMKLFFYFLSWLLSVMFYTFAEKRLRNTTIQQGSPPTIAL